MKPMTGIATHSPSFSLRGWTARHPLSAYFTLAYGFAWALVLPMTFSRNLGMGWLSYDLPDALGIALFILASFVGPTVAALIVTGLTEGKPGVLALLRSLGRWRVAVRWYLAALLINLTIWMLAYSLILGPALLGAALAHWPLLFSVFLPGIAFGMLIPAIGEEPGWRGFALPQLQARYGPFSASLILGALHGLWHLPALGTILFGPFTLSELPPFLLTAVAATFIYTWLYNRSGGSVLLAMLTHAAGNAAAQWLNALLTQSDLVLPNTGWAGRLLADNWINVAAYGTAALLLLALTRGRLGQAEKGL